jgi:2-keto-4-pentenoate hydratase/2-oxohepta-3-ene-1,7-dioic acid hydratase in catechol pathway
MQLLAKTNQDSWVLLDQVPTLDQNGHLQKVLRGRDLGPGDFWKIWQGQTPRLSGFRAFSGNPWTVPLTVPLPNPDIPVWAYGMTYPEHGEETVNLSILRFAKQAQAQLMGPGSLVWQKHLDYEAEIGLLLYRHTPNRFGFLLLNDFTNRGLQVHSFDPANPGPGFTRAKSFPGALQVGPWMAIGQESDWEDLRLELSVNQQSRQRVNAIDCLLGPRQIHRDLFADIHGSDWILAATGTTQGTCFRSPKGWEKGRLFLQSALSINKAKERWLSELKFLNPGDEIVMTSPQLGVAKMTIALDSIFPELPSLGSVSPSITDLSSQMLSYLH